MSDKSTFIALGVMVFVLALLAILFFTGYFTPLDLTRDSSGTENLLPELEDKNVEVLSFMPFFIEEVIDSNGKFKGEIMQVKEATLSIFLEKKVFSENEILIYPGRLAHLLIENRSDEQYEITVFSRNLQGDKKTVEVLNFKPREGKIVSVIVPDYITRIELTEEINLVTKELEGDLKAYEIFEFKCTKNCSENQSLTIFVPKFKASTQLFISSFKDNQLLTAIPGTMELFNDSNETCLLSVNEFNGIENATEITDETEKSFLFAGEIPPENGLSPPIEFTANQFLEISCTDTNTLAGKENTAIIKVQKQVN